MSGKHRQRNEKTALKGCIMKTGKHVKSKGFTLVETMIGVTIVGILTSISIPAFQSARQSSLASSLAYNFRTYSQAFEIYCLDHGDWPADATPGVIPAGMQDDLPNFTETTAIGGNWDWENNAAGVTAGVSLRNSNADVELFKKIDRLLDDGDLSTGRIVGSATLLTMVLQQ